MGKKVINFLNSPITSFVFGFILLLGWSLVLYESDLHEFEVFSFVSGLLLFPISELFGYPLFLLGKWIRKKITRG